MAVVCTTSRYVRESGGAALRLESEVGATGVASFSGQTLCALVPH